MASSGGAKLFVYGTLKRGGSRADNLTGQHFVGEARTMPVYRLYDCGGYPGLVPSGSGISIEGEVWEVDQMCLEQIDKIECVSSDLYRRETVEIGFPPELSGEAVQAYVYQHSVKGLTECSPRW